MHLSKVTAEIEVSSPQNQALVNHDEAVLRSCQAAKQLEEAGDYDGAIGLLGDFWKRVGERPNLDGLGEPAQAELLLRAGSLSGRIGSASQIRGAQEIAKDLLFESSRIFEKIGPVEKIAESQVDLGICYMREGALDEARVTLRQALDKVSEGESEQKLRALASMAMVERTATRYQDALKIHIDAAPLFDRSKNHALRGVFHNQYAIVLKCLGDAESRQDYIDRAFIEYAAAGYHFEHAGHIRYLALVENNLGFLFLTVGKLIESHQHLNRARALFAKLKDKGIIAQVDETRARAFLAQGLFSQAETTVRSSVRTLEQGDENSLLAEALTTHGTALARLERFERAHAQLKRAMDVASQAGDPERAGLAALTIIEMLSSYVSPALLRDYFLSAESFLSQSQCPGAEGRLGQCARAILSQRDSRVDDPETLILQSPAAAETTPEDDVTGEPGRSGSTGRKWEGCSLENAVLLYEGELIQQALEASSGSVTRAARLLGITHQGLAFILNGRHKTLLTVRTPVRRRRKSIFRDESA
jgi:tetratricopeptide (TPR) repeat protein